MEERKLNEAESLKLITTMIQETRMNLQRDCGTPFLIWGYATVFISLLQAALIYMLREENISIIGYTWFILPVAGWIGMLLFNRKKHKTGARNYIERTITGVWIVLSISFLWILAGNLLKNADILYFTVLIMGIGTVISGIAIQDRSTIICGAIAMLSAFLFPLYEAIVFSFAPDGSLMLFGSEPSTDLLKINYAAKCIIFATIFIVMMIIPGHILNHKYNRRCSKN